MLPKAFKSRTKVRLGDMRAVRAELCVVYRACVRGDLEWPDGRAACAILSAIANLDRDVGFEERLNALEQGLAERSGGPTVRNGHHRHMHS